MLFNSYIFIFGFLPLVLLGYYLIPRSRTQLVFLLISSIVFYAYWNVKYVFFLLLTVVLDFYIARAIYYAKTKRGKKLLLISSMTVNLSILGFFKYYGLFAQTVNDVFHSNAPILHILLPIGISFYTFQSMSYVIDVYRGTSDAHASLLSFAGYVTLFPHQISGPLVRHNQIVPQLENSQTYRFHGENFWRGLCFFIVGLAKKVLIADLLAVVVTPVVGTMSVASNTEAIVALFGYTLQLYFDFSGYSDMAVGLGLMMNIQFPQNFNSPYKSTSVTEFWRRWHMTLSSWLKDYLYISLGGNRHGRLNTYRNLLLTMVIGGLWHGGNWTFAAWGLFHGLCLAGERFFRDKKIDYLRNVYLKGIVTFVLIQLAWVFFRSPDFATAGIWFHKIFLLNPHHTWDITGFPMKFRDRFFAALVIGLPITFLSRNTWEMKFKPTLANAIMLGCLLAACLTFLGEESPFLYFQF